MAISHIKLPKVKDPVRVSKTYGTGVNAKVTTMTVERKDAASWLARGFKISK